MNREKRRRRDGERERGKEMRIDRKRQMEGRAKNREKAWANEVLIL